MFTSNQLEVCTGARIEHRALLQAYLEAKRMLFPRFYFISNDDLLEILGQSKNPEAVQPHFKKMFEGIKKLSFDKNGSRWEGITMLAPDPERVDFKDPVPIVGAVEAWLNSVEEAMRVSIHSQTINTCLQLKLMEKKKGKREKWLKEWPVVAHSIQPRHHHAF